MKLTIDVRDEKVDFILELLRNFKYVKIEKHSGEKENILSGLSEAVTEVNRAKRGEIRLQPARELLDEL